MNTKSFVSAVLSFSVICGTVTAPRTAEAAENTVRLIDTASICYDDGIVSTYTSDVAANENGYEYYRANKPVNSEYYGGFAFAQFELSDEQMDEEIAEAEFTCYVTGTPNGKYKIGETVFTSIDSFSEYSASWLETFGYAGKTVVKTNETVTIGGETYTKVTADFTDDVRAMQESGERNVTMAVTSSDTLEKMLAYGSEYQPTLTLTYESELPPAPTEKPDAVYSVITEATGAETIVDTSKMTNSENVTGFLVTVARDGRILSSTETERSDSVAVDAEAGDSIEIAPIYEYPETREYGNGITLPDVFPDGRYDITVTNGSTSHTDIYINGYMVANNIDQSGSGRSVSTGSTYTAHDVKVQGGSITVQTKDSPNSLSYVKVVKSPSVASAKTKIFITGDSLVADYYGGNEDWYLGNTQTGWGQALKNFIDSDKYEMVNLSNAGYWAARLQTTAFPGIIYNALPENGDILLLESGVNDYWNPVSGGETENLPENRETMKKSVTEMVEQAKNAGLTVILITPNAQPSRYGTSNCYSDVMLEVAEEQNVPSIDLAALSSDVLNELYYDEDPDTFKDNIGYNFGVIEGKPSDYTHSSYLGAMKYASIIATELYKLGYADMFDTSYEYTKDDHLGNNVVCKVDTSYVPPECTSSPTPTAVIPEETSSPYPTASSEPDMCTKITAEYNDDGTLKSLAVEDISTGDIEPVENTAEKKVFYWDSLSGMKPVEITAPTPTATAVPTPTVTPTAAPSVPVDADHIFVFGTDENETGIAVSADTAYGEQDNGMSYGFYGLEHSPDVSDGRTDGFKNTDTDPYTVLRAGEINGIPYVTADYSEYDRLTIANMAGGIMPVRFSVEAEQHRYYTVTVTAVNTSETESTDITLYSEKRHAVLAGYELEPGETVTKSFNVNVESVYYNGTGLVEDNQINISLIGRYAGLSSVSIKEHESAGKTIWMCTDSTGCDQPAEIPYFPLRNYSGTGSALTKYINPEIAVSNQGEGGLTAGDSNHFNNAVGHMNEGDYLYVQYGLNDSDPASFKVNLEKYYTAACDKGAKLIVVSPTDRHGRASWDSESKEWIALASGFASAAEEFVEEKIALGAENIAYIDLNTAFIDWMNYTEQMILEQRRNLGFSDTDVDTRAMDYYYLADRRSGVDTIHINDYGTDNAAYLVIQEAKQIVEAGKAENASASEKVQSAVLAELVENMSDEQPCTVSNEIVKAGWPINSLYPYPSSEEVSYQYPTMVKDVRVENGRLISITVMIQGYMNAYAQGCADILDKNGNTKSVVYTVSTDVNEDIGHIDNTSAQYGDIVTMYFDNAEIPEDGSYRVYLKSKENGAELPGDEFYSSIYDEPAAVEEYLLTSQDGRTPDCFEYGLDEGSNIVGNGADNANNVNAWEFAGSANVKNYSTAVKDGETCAALSQNGSGTYTLCKFFNDYKQISDGKIKLHFRINYVYGSFTLKLNQSGRIASWMDGIEILRVADGEVLLCDGTSAGKIKTSAWTDIDVTLDIDRGISEVSIAGGDAISCNIAKLQTSSWIDTEDILPIKGLTIMYTATTSTIPSYPFEFYITDLLITSVETITSQVMVSAVSADDEMGIVTGGGQYGINSDITLTAQANDGYAFAGWYSGETLYSQENPLTLTKVRDDLELTAEFTVQKSKEETASFDITAEKSSVRKDSLLQLAVENAKDKDGYSIGGLTASDISWSSEEPGVSISNEGIVTFDDSFEMEKNALKTVTVTGTINTAVAEYDITVYSYAYYEIMGSETTLYDGSFQIIADKESMIFPTEAGTAVYTLTDKVSLDKNISITLSSARNQANQNRSFKTLSFRNSADQEVFAIYYQYEGVSLENSDPDSSMIWGALPSSGWADIKADIVPGDGIMTITLTAVNTKTGSEETRTLEVSTSELSDMDISAIKLISDSGVVSGRDIGISSIMIEQI